MAELIVARVLEVSDHPGSRAPSYLLRIDLGGRGWREDLDGRDFETMVGVARRVEELELDSIWVYDHLQTREGDPDRVLECWTSLAALARETSTVQLGQIVTAALYRNAGLL